EHQHMLHVVARAELAVLHLEHLQESHNLRLRQLGEREIVPRGEADDPGAAARWPVPIDSRRRRELRRCPGADARMVVVEHEDAGVSVVAPSRAAQVARTEVTVRYVPREGAGGLG